MGLVSNYCTPFLLAALAAALLSACGGGGDDDTPTPTSAETRDALAGLSGRISALDLANGTVTYDFTDAATTTQPLTLYRLSDYTRIDFGGSIVITRPDKSYTCRAASSGQPASCAEGADSSGLPPVTSLTDSQAFLGLFLDADLEAGQVSSSTEAVAGEDADCYSVSAPIGFDDDTRTRVCFGAGGLVLLADYDRAGGPALSLEATEVSDEVPPAVFNPPYPE
jgi:hypothetical protein